MVQQHQQQFHLESRLAGPGQMHHELGKQVGKAAGVVVGGSRGGHYKGHERRQSVARLLPDISKLRLLSWLVEASNELINCDIAIMDGVYAKLNRSRESLLFWQQQQQQKQQQQQQQQRRAPPARPPPPAPPALAPVASAKLLALRQQQYQQQQQPLIQARQPNQPLQSPGGAGGRPRSGAAAGEAGKRAKKAAAAAARNHHSLPLANYDASSLAALSLRSTAATIGAKPPAHYKSPALPTGGRRSIKGQPASSSRSPSNCSSLPTELFCDEAKQAAGGQASGASSKAGPSLAQTNQQQQPLANDSFDSDNQWDAEEEEHRQQQLAATAECSDSDESSSESAASSSDGSTTSSGIHGAASLSSSGAGSCSSSSCASSSSSSACRQAGSRLSLAESKSGPSSSFRPAECTLAKGEEPNREAEERPQLSSAEQLSERIRRCVMEHNYLQTLLVNVIRQHDRALATDAERRPSSSQQLGRHPLGASKGGPSLRVDLAELADSLDDGCLCGCHTGSASQRATGAPLGKEELRCSTLPAASSSQQQGAASSQATSSTLSLFQQKGQSSARKLRRKPKVAAAAAASGQELSREEILEKFSDRMCQSCFETHYWLHSCSHFAPLEFAATLGDATPALLGNNSNSNNNNQTASLGPGSSAQNRDVDQSDDAFQLREQIDNLNSVIALRNATFIKLVQQQVRSTISKSIELIDLIRKEIKSPESIKQKQLMRCFSASVQLLTSVANYVVPTQDISTFIPNELSSSMMISCTSGSGATAASTTSSSGAGSSNNQQQTVLFNLPPSDFDHLLIYPSSRSNLSQLPSKGSPYLSQASELQQTPTVNYHIAAAPEIPPRRKTLPVKFLEQLQQQKQQLPILKINDDYNSCPNSGAPETTPTKGHSSSLTRSDGHKLRPNAQDHASSAAADQSAAQIDKSTGATTTTTTTTTTKPNQALIESSSSGASSNNSSASSSIARGAVQQSSLVRAQTTDANSARSIEQERKVQTYPTSQDLVSILSPYSSPSSLGNNKHHHQLRRPASPHHHQQHDYDFLAFQSTSRQPKFWQSPKFNFIKKLLQVKQQRLLRQQSKDRRIYNNKVQNKFRLVMMDLTHFNKSQQLLTTENGVNSLLTSMRNVLEFGLYLTVKLY